jgi:hypothetical protein
LLRGAPIGPEEVTRASQAAGVSEEEIACSRLVVADGVNVLQENLKFLLQDVEHGRKGTVAQRLDVHPSTLSKWCVGKQRPERKKLSPLCDCLGVEAGTDLEQVSLFLRPGPVGDGQRRRWLHDRIARLSPELLRALFPALERLLEER